MTQVRILGKSRYGVGALALVLAVSVTACAPQAADQNAELGALTDKWEEALNGGDIGALASLYADDCVLMPPNMELMTGRAAAAAAFGDMINAGQTGELDTITAVAAGGFGYHTGTYWVKDESGTIIDRGKYMEGWQKVDGEWQIVHDIWNSDLAPFAGATTVAITHDVKDADNWLAAWQGENSRKGDFARHGVANVRVFQNQEKQKQVGLVVDVADMEAFHAYLKSEEGAAAKAEDGVIDKGMRVYMEVK
jgi:ketosteroid isomerase-like protein